MSEFESSRNYINGKVIFDSNPVEISGNVFISGTLSASAIIGGGGGGSTSPGGSNTNIQYNNGGLFAGSNNFIWNNATNTVAILGDLSGSGNISGSAFYGNGFNLTSVAKGANTQIQYNADGELAGDTGFTWNSGSNTLGITGNLSQTGDYTLTGAIYHLGEVNLAGPYYQTGDYFLTGAFNHLGNSSHIGNYIQTGDYTLTGAFNHSGSTLHIGDTTQTGSYTVSGSMTINGPLVAAGGLQFGGNSFATASLSANTDNLLIPNLENSILVRLEASPSNYNLTGIVVPDNTKTFFFAIFNVGTRNITFKDEDASSNADNRFLLGADVLIQGGEGITLIYDPVDTRWRSPGKNI